MRRGAIKAARVGATTLILAAATACGGGTTTAATIGPTAPPPQPSITGTSDDSCYLVELDLRTLADLRTGEDGSTVLTQMTEDASTGSPALQQAVAAYVKAEDAQQSGDAAAIRMICHG